LAELPYMPLFCADYLTATVHLSESADRAYFHLLMHYWLRQAALPADDEQLYRMAGTTKAKWLKVKAEVLPFFEERGGLLFNRRSDEEIANARRKSELGKAAADARWRDRPKKARR